MLTAVDVRRLRLGDLAAIERVERRAYPTPWSRTMFAGEIAKATSLCFGGFAGDQLAGYVIVSRHVDAWHVMNVAVDDPFRGQGLGQRLLETVFKETANDGTRGYTLEVRVSNHGAIRLYERLAFQPTGIRRGYYTDNREDALIMWRDSVPLEGDAAPS
jgi:ribosomal-protein-alanine N-acetyltransferase